MLRHCLSLAVLVLSASLSYAQVVQTPTVLDENGKPQKVTPVIAVDENGEYAAGGGGGSSGTEYTEGDTDATITGTALMWEDGSDTLRVPSAANPLPVDTLTLPADPLGANADAAATAGGTGSISAKLRLATDLLNQILTGVNDTTPAQLAPSTSGGLLIKRSLDLDESEEDVKTSAGQVYCIWATNTNASARWLKLYNATAANVTVGTTTPVISIAIPGNSSGPVTGALCSGTFGIAFDTAISAAATTAQADNDTGAPGANEVTVNVFYK